MTCPRVTVITSATLLWTQNCSRPRTQASIRVDGLQLLKMDTVKGMISFMVRPLMYSSSFGPSSALDHHASYD
ncbi:hypothetical protein IEO21_08769 [Rhodonia placenta]|uniref:Uncharacterized protein n=1 Tax=Rhodonia placenta TaxID=104341 RepID=A0A8H7NVJ3_9APHY|nr:hypothetical protein IEO21_08769 [Postia placenta]